MGYVAVRGGGIAIEESLKLLEFERVRSSAAWGTDEIEHTFPELIDQVMGEASLYAPRLAALALKQAQGSPDEAVFLLRAFRSTLERPYVSRSVDTAELRISRRISAAFKDVPGGQVLGATRDYSHRLLAFDLETEGSEELADKRAELARHFAEIASPQEGDAAGRSDGTLPRVLDYLRAEGLVAHVSDNDGEPVDATMVPLTFPAPRSVRLQTLARGMTQAVEALGYAAIRGFGPAHPTVGELRQGRAAVAVDHPLSPGGPEDAYYLGSVPLCEVESVFMDEGGSSSDAAAFASGQASALSLAVGYGLVFGRAETKAIAMSVLDRCLDSDEVRYPTEDEEFVLYHVDGVEATGFISHLKLPHYVTFQSKLSSVRGTRDTAVIDPASDRTADQAAAAALESKEACNAAAL
ncbi:MAG: carbon-phosphorus lyase complex subunit PhnI [Gordonibacter sp.]|uniref:carbon-phosphorus lyase complex subunit PhnI n=1 Tax=Gordonibacter sp. TaxID=1968902 RepID=UPI002FCAD696